jgi:hypothetical protein
VIPYIGIVLACALYLAYEALAWRRCASEWRQIARVTAILADELIELHDPDHDAVSVEIREELRKIREGAIA